MPKIHDNEKLLLTILSALDIPKTGKQDENINIIDYSNYTVADFVNYYTDNNTYKKFDDKYPEGKVPNMMSRDEWIQTLSQIKKRPELMDLQVKQAIHDESTGLNAFCYEQSQDTAIVVFGGSTGNGWGDDLKGSILADTFQQKAALD